MKWGKDQTGLISYTFNQQGFRDHTDYNQEPEIAFFGNSIVFGVGVPIEQTLCKQFCNSQNYGLSGNYMNHHSVTNLEQFIKRGCKSRIVFFWIDRNESIEQMIKHTNSLAPNILHISSGSKYTGAINLMPAQDQDVSGTHPGVRTHQIWAKTIKSLLNRA